MYNLLAKSPWEDLCPLIPSAHTYRLFNC